jgi:thiol-disulfide isomerase/thioredoxin
MKKLFLCLLIVLLLCGCGSKRRKIVSKIDIATKKVDMSGYQGMSSTDHQFLEVDLYDVYEFIEKGGSGIFYLGYTNCHNCQDGVRYLNEVAKELGVTVYYINIDREDYHVSSDRAVYDEVVEKLNPILGTDKDGKKGIFTPDVFQVIDGEFGDHHVGLVSSMSSVNPSKESIEELKAVYRELLEPFQP